MSQGNNPQEHVQAIRSVDKSIRPNAVVPATADEIYHVDTHPDPETQKEIVLWDDILQAFDNAVQVRHGTRVVPFLKGTDFTILLPRRIAAVPNTILDVVVDSLLVDKGVTSTQVQPLALQPTPPQDDDSALKVEVVSQNVSPASSATSRLSVTSAPNTTSSSCTHSTATSTVSRNPVYGLVETAMENYSHIDRPLGFPSARGPQTVQDDQTCTAKDLPARSHPNSDNEAQQRAPQNATTDVSMERDVVQMSISASHGDKDAQVALGDMYRDGKGVAQDYQSAMDWYLKAVEQGDAAGQQRVGALYGEGFGVPQNYSIAMDWYLKAAEQGHTASQYNLGVFYKHGRGVPLDYKQAMDWFLKAADQGHAGSQYNIGEFYHFDRGVRQDFAQAMNWYLKAAQQGHARSHFNIGLLYNHGQGVPQDYTKAAEWFSKAADRGYDGAKIVLKTLERRVVFL